MKYALVYGLLFLVAIAMFNSCSTGPCRDGKGKIVPCKSRDIDRPGKYDRF